MTSNTDGQVYAGEERMILALDIGTTTSAVSYIWLIPGKVPEPEKVIKWRGQPEVSGSSKVPTRVTYKGGVATAHGAETDRIAEFDHDEEDGSESANEDNVVVKWFKLYLHTDTMNKSAKTGLGRDKLEDLKLPPGVELIDVYSSFLGYLYKSTKEFFTGKVPDGENIWERLEGVGTMGFVFAVPNGWEASQFAFLRRAAIKSGLVDESTADERLDFVSEGEASVHYVLENCQNKAWLREGVMFAVIDAGGSTVDSNLYKCKSIAPKLILEEVCASECVQAGGEFVDRGAYKMFQTILEGSRFCQKEIFDKMIKKFEQRVKRLFDGTNQANIIDFGGTSDSDKDYNVKRGKISLSRYEVSSTFEKPIAMIVDSCTRLTAGREIKHILLVGGFGESPYLQKRLKEIFGEKNTEIVSLEQPMGKAASEGAAIWYLKRLVDGRAARFAIGTSTARPFNLFDPNHRERFTSIHMDAEGDLVVSGIFHKWVEKDEIMTDDMQKEFTYHTLFRRMPEELKIDNFEVLCMDSSNPPYWAEDEDGDPTPGIRTLCRIGGNLETMRPYVKEKTRPDGEKFYHMSFQIVLWFGGTKLRAKIQWKEGDQLREGPATIFPSSNY